MFIQSACLLWCLCIYWCGTKCFFGSCNNSNYFPNNNRRSIGHGIVHAQAPHSKFNFHIKLMFTDIYTSIHNVHNHDSLQSQKNVRRVINKENPLLVPATSASTTSQDHAKINYILVIFGVLKCLPTRGRTCCWHTHGFKEGRWGSLKLVACSEEACSAGPAASGALLAGAPVQCMRYERSRPCQSNHSLQSFFVWV